MLIFMIIGLVLSIVMYFVLGWIWEAAVESMQGYASGVTGGMSVDTSSMSDLFSLLG
jgi:hypothetical protein